MVLTILVAKCSGFGSWSECQTGNGMYLTEWHPKCQLAVCYSVAIWISVWNLNGRLSGVNCTIWKLNQWVQIWNVRYWDPNFTYKFMRKHNVFVHTLSITKISLAFSYNKMPFNQIWVMEIEHRGSKGLSKCCLIRHIAPLPPNSKFLIPFLSNFAPILFFEWNVMYSNN